MAEESTGRNIEPCPFCGRKPVLVHTCRYHDGKPYRAYCGTLTCRLLATEGYAHWEDMVDKWNELCEAAKNIELLPCPKCGQMPVVEHCPNEEFYKWMIVSCKNPDCEFTAVSYGRTETGAKKNWKLNCEAYNGKRKDS